MGLWRGGNTTLSGKSRSLDPNCSVPQSWEDLAGPLPYTTRPTLTDDLALLAWGPEIYTWKTATQVVLKEVRAGPLCSPLSHH